MKIRDLIQNAYTTAVEQAEEDQRNRQRREVMRRREKKAREALDDLCLQIHFLKHAVDVQESHRVRLGFASLLQGAIWEVAALEEDTDLFLKEFLQALDVKYAEDINAELLLRLSYGSRMENARRIAMKYINEKMPMGSGICQ